MTLEIYAGQKALNTIENEGFKQELFTSFLGASGGPKWFVLSGLDKYLFGEFFKLRTTPLNVIGSSIGSFRAACFCQDDPAAAIDRFIDAYFSVTYESRPTPQEVTDSSEPVIKAILGVSANEANQGASHSSDNIEQILNNPIFKAHFIVARTKGLVARENKYLQLAGLMKSFINNAVSRSKLSSQYQRYIFQRVDSELNLFDQDGFDTNHIPLTSENIKDALLASGCIPLVMSGIRDIAGSDKGMYRDGGIVDYHFDFKINNPGLILYPHFNSTIKPGWFDKGLKRSFDINNYDNTVVVCPSKEFIHSLPYQKISDRTDFEKMTDQDRLAYWQTIVNRSQDLAEDFANFTDKQDFAHIQPIETLQQ